MSFIPAARCSSQPPDDWNPNQKPKVSGLADTHYLAGSFLVHGLDNTKRETTDQTKVHLLPLSLSWWLIAVRVEMVMILAWFW